MQITVIQLLLKIRNQIPDLDIETLTKLQNILDAEFSDCIIEKKTYELMETNLNEKYVKEFFLYLEMSNKSKKTAIQYGRELKKMILHINKNVTDITREDLKGYYAWYKLNHSVKPVTILNLQRYISPFFRFMVREGYMSSNQACDIDAPKIKDPNITAITQEELEIIRNTANNWNDNPKRCRALIEFLLSTGCRVSEIENCKISDVDFSVKSIEVMGKGNKTRTVFFNGTCAKYLKDYLSGRTDNIDSLFISKDNKPWSKGSIEMVCRNIGKKTGIRCNPHRFRHTFAQICIDRGMNLEDLSKIMGHEEVSTTMKYFKVNRNKIEAAYKKYVA